MAAARNGAIYGSLTVEEMAANCILQSVDCILQSACKSGSSRAWIVHTGSSRAPTRLYTLYSLSCPACPLALFSVIMTNEVGSVIRLRGVRHNNLKNFDLDLAIG